MTLKIGTILIAKEDIKDGITKGNEYTIYKVGEKRVYFNDDDGYGHYFEIESLLDFFTIKRYTLTDLQTRTDLMVRIDSEEQAKKLGNKWYNTHYFSDELLYGYIKGAKEIIYLDADEIEGRTLIPSIDLIDLEEKEETKEVINEAFYIQKLESEITRLKGENEDLKKVINLVESTEKSTCNKYSSALTEIAQLKHQLHQLQQPKSIPELTKRERMAWELMLRSVQVENSKHYSLSAEYCLNEVDTFLAKSKEVGK